MSNTTNSNTIAAFRSEAISACREGRRIFVRSSVTRNGADVPTCVSGYVTGVSPSSVAVTSGDRVVVLALASVREITDAPPIPLTFVPAPAGEEQP